MSLPVIEPKAQESPQRGLALWVENPYRLWSLLVVFEACAAEFVLIGDRYRWIEFVAQKHARKNLPVSQPPGVIVKVGEALSEIIGLCDRIGATASADSARIVLQNLPKTPKWELIARDIQISFWAFYNEMKRWHLLLLEPQEARLYSEGPESQFGPESLNAFPGTVFDIEEACKCLALHRGTATVFHLMRVSEIVTKAVWLSLQTEPSKAPPGWGTYKKGIEVYLDNKEGADRPPYWKQRESFYRETHAHLSAVYRAWRNPTMHPERTYTVEEATEIFDATKGLVRHVAAHVDQDGNYT